MVESKNQALLELATAVLRSEATAILDAADMLDGSFCKAIELLQNCTGSVVDLKHKASYIIYIVWIIKH